MDKTEILDELIQEKSEKVKTISILNSNPIVLGDNDGLLRWGDFFEVDKNEVVNLNFNENEAKEIFMGQMIETIKAINKEKGREIEIVALEYFWQPSHKKDIMEYHYIFWGK